MCVIFHKQFFFCLHFIMLNVNRNSSIFILLIKFHFLSKKRARERERGRERLKKIRNNDTFLLSFFSYPSLLPVQSTEHNLYIYLISIFYFFHISFKSNDICFFHTSSLILSRKRIPKSIIW